MALFCSGIDYPMNIICNWGWRLAIIFVIFFVIWLLIYPKNKDR